MSQRAGAEPWLSGADLSSFDMVENVVYNLALFLEFSVVLSSGKGVILVWRHVARGGETFFFFFVFLLNKALAGSEGRLKARRGGGVVWAMVAGPVGTYVV
jgi:hypothetical protein